MLKIIAALMGSLLVVWSCASVGDIAEKTKNSLNPKPKEITYFDEIVDLVPLPVSVHVASNPNSPEAYLLEITRSGINITGEEAGIMHARTTLDQIRVLEGNRVQARRISDWPDHRVRGFHLPLLEPLSPDAARGYITLAHQLKFNTVIVALNDYVRFPTLSKVSNKNGWTVAQFRGVLDFARDNGLQPIIEIKLLSHQQRLLKNAYPELMYNRLTYDPRNEDVYRLILPMMREVVEATAVKAIHIGHDEVAGYDYNSQTKLGPGASMLPPDLFLEDVLRIHGFLGALGVEVWMWGDMLLSRSEFPFMTEVHGGRGYSDLRDKLPKDIVICDWHYHDLLIDFPSSKAFKKAGHKVVGCTWDRPWTIGNFSRYMAKIHGDGMIATLWGSVVKDVEKTTDIMRVSGEKFWNCERTTERKPKKLEREEGGTKK